MLNEWLSAWLAYHGITERVDSGDQLALRFFYFSQRGDTRDIRASIAEFDEQLTSWLHNRTVVVWRTRPRWTPHFLIECEVAAEW